MNVRVRVQEVVYVTKDGQLTTELTLHADEDIPEGQLVGMLLYADMLFLCMLLLHRLLTLRT